MVVSEITWNVMSVGALSQFLTARQKGVVVELTVQTDLGKGFKNILPESLRIDMLALSDSYHVPAAVPPSVVSSSSVVQASVNTQAVFCITQFLVCSPTGRKIGGGFFCLYDPGCVYLTPLTDL